MLPVSHLPSRISNSSDLKSVIPQHLNQVFGSVEDFSDSSTTSNSSSHSRIIGATDYRWMTCASTGNVRSFA